MTLKRSWLNLRNAFVHLQRPGGGSRAIRCWPLAAFVLVTVIFFPTHDTEAAIIVTSLPGQAYAGADGTGVIPVALSNNNPGLSGSIEANTKVAGAFAEWDITSQGATFRASATGTLGIGTSQASAAIRYALTSSFGGPIQSKPAGFGGINLDVNYYFGPREQYGSVVWTDGDYFPGERENPRLIEPPGPGRPPEPPDPSVFENTPGTRPSIVNGAAYLTSLPVEGDFGVTSPVYFAGHSPVVPTAMPLVSSGADVTGYYFQSVSDARFTSFSAPDGIAGDTSQIVINDGTNLIPYVPGTTLQFASPLSIFAIIGLDKSILPADGPAPFVHALTFEQAGAAIFVEGTMISVPEPSTVALAIIGALGLLLFARRETLCRGRAS